MAYEYTNRQTDAWNWESQCALWRERALHSARRAEFFRRLLEAERNGSTITEQKGNKVSPNTPTPEPEPLPYTIQEAA